MDERSTFDAFEERLAGAFVRYVAPAVDPRPAIEVAAVAMQPRGLGVRSRAGSRGRSLLLLGLAAAFLVPAAYVGVVGLQRTMPAPVDQGPPSRAVDAAPTVAPSVAEPAGSLAIFLRRVESPEPGLAVVAVRPDGSEAGVRTLPDPMAPGLGDWHDGATLSGSRWLTSGGSNGARGGPWWMVLVDLADQDSEPWLIVSEGIRPSWGPTGLIAAGSESGSLLIADPESRETRTVSLRGYQLVDGGGAIVWTADGSGVVGVDDAGEYAAVPIDGGDPRSPVGQIFGPGMAVLRICEPGTGCPGGDDGRVERVEVDGSARTIWRQEDSDRAFAASFGDDADEYWLSLDHDRGRQIAIVHVKGDLPEIVATVDRASTWRSVGVLEEAPDGSAIVLPVYDGGSGAAVHVPLDGRPQTFHPGGFVGFVDGPAAMRFATQPYRAPVATLPPAGDGYVLPSLRELIAAWRIPNPARRLLGKASHDGVEGDTEVRDVEVRRDKPGQGTVQAVMLDCLGPSSVTVRSGPTSVTYPCVWRGGGVLEVDESSPVVVTASGETTWRVVIYIYALRR